MDNGVCRVCLGVGALKSIFKKQNKISYSSKIMSISKVQIHPDDGLPNEICVKCIKRLKKCIQFIQQCEESDAKLRSREKKGIDSKIINYDTENSTGYLHDSMNGEYYKEEFSDIKEELQSNFLSNTVDDGVMALEELNQESQVTSSTKKNCKSRKEQCPTCGKVMSSRFRLKTHLRTHTGERPYSCPHCDKHFSLAQSLKVHIRTHTGEKPLCCPECDATFAQPAGLAAHRLKHTGALPHKCTQCHRAFRTMGHLHYHIRCHTGEKNFECDTCGRAFITRSDLKQHVLTHTGAKPHVCSICGLGLTRASHLKRHISIHSGNKPFKCGQCRAQFTQRSDLTKHSKKHDEVVSATVEINT